MKGQYEAEVKKREEGEDIIAILKLRIEKTQAKQA